MSACGRSTPSRPKTAVLSRLRLCAAARRTGSVVELMHPYASNTDRFYGCAQDDC